MHLPTTFISMCWQRKQGPGQADTGTQPARTVPGTPEQVASALSPTSRTSSCLLGVQMSQKSSGGVGGFHYSSLAAVAAASAEGPLLPYSLSVTLPFASCRQVLEPPSRTPVWDDPAVNLPAVFGSCLTRLCSMRPVCLLPGFSS